MRGRRLAALAALLLVAGCGQSDGEPESAAAEPARTDTVNGIDPLTGAATSPVAAEPQDPEAAVLERVAVGRHEGFDRVVFQFRDHVPGFRVSYVEPPLREDGSGNLVEVEGDAIVLVRMEPASGFDFTGEGQVVYDGPRRIAGSGAGTSVVRELVRTGDFEAVLSWAVGLDQRVDFRVQRIDGPPRLVVDFRDH